MIQFIHKEEYTHLATRMYNADPVSALTFIAIGEFTRRGETVAHPFSIQGFTRGNGLWEYDYSCWLRFTPSEMQNLRQKAKHHPSNETISVPGETPTDSQKNLHAMLLSKQTRIYPLREAEHARTLGAQRNGDGVITGWYIPRHLDASMFAAWLTKPLPSADTPFYPAIKTTGGEVVIKANPAELAPHSTLKTSLPNGQAVFVGINSVGKEFGDPPIAYHRFEVIEIFPL